MGSRLAVICILLIASGGLASAVNLITNGDFETGTLSGWTVTNAPGGTSNISVTTLPSPDFTFGAAFGAVGTDFDTISQTFATTPGAFYDFSFFYQVGNTQFQADNHFIAFFNGVNLYDNLNANPGFITLTFTNLQATGSTTTVEFDGRNNPFFDFLDNVTVTSSANVPDTGTTVLLLGMGVIALMATKRTFA